jgi:hypothetical protein
MIIERMSGDSDKM